jgi:hypothetical protein
VTVSTLLPAADRWRRAGLAAAYALALLSGAWRLYLHFLPPALRHAEMARARLRGVCLARVDLAGASLRGADLRDADLRDADLRGACLRGADLRGARLTGAHLGGADLRGAFFDTRTAWPTGFNAAARGAEARRASGT